MAPRCLRPRSRGVKVARTPTQTVNRLIWLPGGPGQDRFDEGVRIIPEETAIAMTYNGGTYAVMMGTPRELKDFAVGFSLTEGIVKSPDEIDSIDIVGLGDGVELRIWLQQPKADLLNERRRHIAGPTGCGLCGIDSIAEAIRPAAIVARGASFSPREIMAAMQSLPPLQSINLKTRAVHAAAFWMPARGIVALREDVGRHNALDKLAGALAHKQLAASEGMVLLTSRVSVEMVQKAAAIGAPLIVAVSAPTALAVRVADASGITLAAVARSDGFELFTHPGRIVPGMTMQG
jgi:FdhD protein